MRTKYLLTTLLLCCVLSVFSQMQTKVPPIDKNNVLSWGDQGDGTYKNPIINGDYSDPDVIRVGSDYYMVTSTFHLSPGLTVLHSLDLVNWQIVSNALSDISDFDKVYSADNMGEYSHGVWAPAIRYYEGKFWIYVCDPVYGLFMTKTLMIVALFGMMLDRCILLVLTLIEGIPILMILFYLN